MAFPHEAILVFNFFTARVDAFPHITSGRKVLMNFDAISKNVKILQIGPVEPKLWKICEINVVWLVDHAGWKNHFIPHGLRPLVIWGNASTRAEKKLNTRIASCGKATMLPSQVTNTLKMIDIFLSNDRREELGMLSIFISYMMLWK